ncbi:MAG: hypothetical protein RMK30_06525 [Anaerolineae bacterium]|nr:hypothetical protein [Anaerolineae bacterium]MDW8102515.1 hypothetical protein [Anaerolineae bacterium]
MEPLRIEVIAPILESYGLCVSCQVLMQEAGLKTESSDYPPEWKEDFRRLVDWVLELSRSYGDKVYIILIDPRSLQGLWRCLRHRVSRYPSFIIQGKRYYVGWDKEALRRVIDSFLAS